MNKVKSDLEIAFPLHRAACYFEMRACTERGVRVATTGVLAQLQTQITYSRIRI